MRIIKILQVISISILITCVKKINGAVCSTACSNEFVNNCVPHQKNINGKTEAQAYQQCRNELEGGTGPIANACTVKTCTDTSAMAALKGGSTTPSTSPASGSECSSECSGEFVNCVNFKKNEGKTQGQAYQQCRNELEEGVGPIAGKCPIRTCSDTSAMKALKDGTGGGNNNNEPTSKPSIPTRCATNNKGSCECGDETKGFTTYTFWLEINEQVVQRCFTVFRPSNRKTEVLPVLLRMQCYAKDTLGGMDMINTNSPTNSAAERYGYATIGLSSPAGHWDFGNNNIVNDKAPMPCSNEDSDDIIYLKYVFNFIEKDNLLNHNKLYTEGFSQNSMFAAYTAFCFQNYSKSTILGVWQGGSGMGVNGMKPYLPGMQAQCSEDSFVQYKQQCIQQQPCTECKYWPIYPCYHQPKPMIDCVMEYTNDQVSTDQTDLSKSSAIYMHDKLILESHAGNLLRFSPSSDGSIDGGHKDVLNKEHWLAGCLGITNTCSEACENEFFNCMDSKSYTDAKSNATNFAECFREPGFSTNLQSCTSTCAPTLRMLQRSEMPTTTSITNFGEITNSFSRNGRNSNSICQSNGASVTPNLESIYGVKKTTTTPYKGTSKSAGTTTTGKYNELVTAGILTTTAAAINVLDGRSTASPTVTHIAATTIAAAVGAVFYDCRGANCCGKGTLFKNGQCVSDVSYEDYLKYANDQGAVNLGDVSSTECSG